MEPPQTHPEDDEDSIIAAVLAARPPGRASSAAVDAGDDAAVLAGGTAVTVDTLVEGVHWNDRLTPADVGWKAVAVSVSDLAATGAAPRWAVLSLALPEADTSWVAEFSRGLAEACAHWTVDLVGGDTVRTSGPRVVTLTLGGACVAAPLRRDAAQAGDDLWVTGRLGLAGAGWRRDAPSEEALAALRRPRPPLAFALAVAEAGLAHAAMDLSDGLARDLPRLCEASGVGAIVDAEAIPGADHLGEDALLDQTRGGEDYQLLLAAAPAQAGALRALAGTHATSLTRIGGLTADGPARLRGRAWPAPTFQHFAGAT